MNLREKVLHEWQPAKRFADCMGIHKSRVNEFVDVGAAEITQQTAETTVTGVVHYAYRLKEGVTRESALALVQLGGDEVTVRAPQFKSIHIKIEQKLSPSFDPDKIAVAFARDLQKASK